MPQTISALKNTSIIYSCHNNFLLKSFLILCVAFLLPVILFAQERCATEKFDSIRRSSNPKLETKDQFEDWMESQLKKKEGSGFQTERAQSTYTIPVVVHIIHNGQAIGTGSNISDAQVISQIKVLNNDFQRLNADASQTPAVFQSVAGAMSIEFVLAKQDPLGNATTGIVRVNGGQSSWNLYEDAEMKGKSYWPAEQYFNIWVTNFEDYLGYTQFPVSGLPGLGGSPNDRLTDGIIIHYRAFGSKDDGAFDLESQYDKGRTVTHEVGHFFGLRHIWGDGSSCSATDYVADTPPQIGSSANCPTHPDIECSGLAKMFQNYLDYTDDRCMNIFTVGQIGRMDVVLSSSPRRASLTSSTGSLPPGNFSVDLGILSVETPTTLECSGTHTPVIIIHNFGTTTITQAVIELKVNGSIFQTNTVTLSLPALQQTQVVFNNYSSSPLESTDFEFTINTVNGTSDEYPGNNSVSLTTETAALATMPYIENFESTLSDWNVTNPDELISWTSVTLPSSGGNAIYMHNYDYEIEGAIDKIYSPSFNVSAATGLLLKFKLAYAQRPGWVGEALSVYAFNVCADDLTTGALVFYEEGANLSTRATSWDDFVPTTASDWETKYIPLNQFIGASNFRFAFVNRNGNGNNIYIDEVELVAESVVNLSIQSVMEPSMAVCESPIIPKLKIANLGTTVISGLTIAITKNGTAQPGQSNSTVLNPGNTTEIILNNLSLSAGANNVSITVTPNGPPDSSPGDNTVLLPITFITNATKIPVRENFNTVNSWSVANPVSEGWAYAPTNFGQSAVFQSFDNLNIGAESWLVSPKMDFTNTIEASMFADFSYAYRAPNEEVVTVSISDDCGKTFTAYSTFNLNQNAITDLAWVPTSNADWSKEYFDLGNYARKENILVAIQAINSNGNNLYIDNIEFFENKNSNPAIVPEPFLIYNQSGTTYITFNLEESQAVQVQVTNLMGSQLTNFIQENTLNQTLTFNLDVAPGIYIFKIRIGEKLYVQKQFMKD